MKTLRQAAETLADYAREQGALIEQIDVQLCEDGETVAFHAWDERDDGAVAIADIPMTLNDESELLEDEWRSALFALLPASVLAESAKT